MLQWAGSPHFPCPLPPPPPLYFRVPPGPYPRPSSPPQHTQPHLASQPSPTSPSPAPPHLASPPPPLQGAHSPIGDSSGARPPGQGPGLPLDGVLPHLHLHSLQPLAWCIGQEADSPLAPRGAVAAGCSSGGSRTTPLEDALALQQQPVLQPSRRSSYDSVVIREEEEEEEGEEGGGGLYSGGGDAGGRGGSPLGRPPSFFQDLAEVPLVPLPSLPPRPRSTPTPGREGQEAVTGAGLPAGGPLEPQRTLQPHAAAGQLPALPGLAAASSGHPAVAALPVAGAAGHVVLQPPQPLASTPRPQQQAKEREGLPGARAHGELPGLRLCLRLPVTKMPSVTKLPGTKPLPPPPPHPPLKPSSLGCTNSHICGWKLLALDLALG